MNSPLLSWNKYVTWLGLGYRRLKLNSPIKLRKNIHVFSFLYERDECINTKNTSRFTNENELTEFNKWQQIHHFLQVFSSSSSSRQECTHTWVLILRAWPNCTGKNQSYIQLKTDCYLHLGLHWESDRPKSCSELVDGRDQSKFLRYVTPGEYGTRKEGVFISVNSGVDYSIYSSSSGSFIGWYK